MNRRSSPCCAPSARPAPPWSPCPWPRRAVDHRLAARPHRGGHRRRRLTADADRARAGRRARWPGVEVNLAVLGAGLAAIALLPLALLAGAAWRAARAAGGPLGVAEPAQPGAPLADRRRRSPAAGSVTGGVGVAMAFEPGHGRTAVPVRSALAGSVIAVAALTAAAVFGASLVALVSTPRDYGQNWDAQLDLGFGGAPGAFGAHVIGGRARGDRVRVGQLRPAGDRRPNCAGDRCLTSRRAP